MDTQAIIEAGIAKMRDPNTKQGFGWSIDSRGRMCAMGCIRMAAVEAGVGKLYTFTIEKSVGDERVYKGFDYNNHAAEWYAIQSSLDAHVGITNIIDMNDTQRLPLPEIADVIEAKYKVVS